MARRRHQAPELQRSETKGGKQDRWWFRAYIDVIGGDGTKKRVEKSFHLGYCRDLGKREALKELADQVAVLNQPALVISSQVRFGIVLEEFLKNCDVKPQTMRAYQSMVDAHLKPRWGDVRLCDITPLEVERWIREKARKLAKATYTCIRAMFSQVWKCALRWGYTQAACPMLLVPKIANFGHQKRGNKLPTIEQFGMFLDELDRTHRNIVIVALETGMRIGEILAIRWRQANTAFLTIEESRSQRGEVGTPKDDEARTVPFRRVVLKRPEDTDDEDFVFPVTYHGVREALKEAAEVIGIYYPGFGAHTFRRMHNTLLRRAADVEVAKKQLGHADARTNDIYNVVDADEELQERASIIELMMGKVMGGVQ